MKLYLYRLFVALSILVSALSGGRAYQTFSALNYEWRRQGKYNMVDLIDLLHREPHHCLTRWVNWKLCHSILTKYGMDP